VGHSENAIGGDDACSEKGNPVLSRDGVRNPVTSSRKHPREKNKRLLNSRKIPPLSILNKKNRRGGEEKCLPWGG